MPKNLFFTLSGEKQNKIKTAAINEFSEHQYHEASINQIIKVAGISRGSFYQYFEDKEDLYFYLIDIFLEVKLDAFIKSDPAKLCTDVISFNRQMFLFILSIISEDRYKSFTKNLFLSMTYEFEKRFMSVIESRKQALLSENFSDVITILGDKITYFEQLLAIIALIIRDLLKVKVIENVDDKSIIEIYDIRMELLRRVRDLKKEMEDT